MLVLVLINIMSNKEAILKLSNKEAMLVLSCVLSSYADVY